MTTQILRDSRFQVKQRYVCRVADRRVVLLDETPTVPGLGYQVARTASFRPPTNVQNMLDEIADITAALEQKRLEDDEVRPAKRRRLYLTSLLPREHLVAEATSFGRLGKVRLSETVLPFGPFNGLTLGQIAGLRKGNVVSRWIRSDRPEAAHDPLWWHLAYEAKKVPTVTSVKPDLGAFQERVRDQGAREAAGRLHYVQVPLTFNLYPFEIVWHTEVTSETEGVRYLDRLLDTDKHHWLYPNYLARVILFLTDRRVRLDRIAAYSNQGPVTYVAPGTIRNPSAGLPWSGSDPLPKRERKARRKLWRATASKNARKVASTTTSTWIDGSQLDALCVANYGDAEAIAPSDFLCKEEETPDRWHAAARERLAKRGGSPADDDPTPEGWGSVDPVRLDGRRGGDPWEDFRATPLNDLDWGYVPGYESSKPASQDEALKVRPVYTPFEVVKDVVTYRLRDRDESITVERTSKKRGFRVLMDVPVGLPAEAEGSAVKLGTTCSPHEEAVSRRAWDRGIRAIADLERIGGPAEQPLADYRRDRADWEAAVAGNRACRTREPRGWYERLEEVKDQLRHDLGVQYTSDEGEVRTRWHPSVPADLQATLTRAVKDATARLDAMYLEQSREIEAKREQEEAEATSKFLAAIGSLALVLVNREKYRGRKRFPRRFGVRRRELAVA